MMEKSGESQDSPTFLCLGGCWHEDCKMQLGCQDERVCLFPSIEFSHP